MEKLKSYIEKRGLSQNEFSKRAGVTKSTMSRIMNGQEPKLSVIMKIRAATNGEVRPEHWI